MDNYQKQFIELILERQALKFGDFKLPSGKKTPYFFNLGELNSAEDLSLISKCFAKTIYKHCIQENLDFSIIFGAAYKGIPLATATILALKNLYDINILLSSNRKENKNHGEGGVHLGAPLENQNILILDDVIAEGVTSFNIANFIKSEGGIINGLIVALDRQDLAKNQTIPAATFIAAELKIPVFSIITFKDILEYLKTSSAHNYAYLQLKAHL